MNQCTDWQNGCRKLSSRGQYLLETEKWADCSFLVGTQQNQEMISGHKLILAMGSPVFERMFFGNIPDKNDTILIPDVQPDAFRSLMEYIYTDKINIASFDKACELCYVAKKYLIPHIVEQCTQYLWSDLCPKNACRAFEFAKLFEEPGLMERCLQIISTKTCDVIEDPSFMEIDLSTLLTILDQKHLNINSELDLFNVIEKYAETRGYSTKSNNNCDMVDKSLELNAEGVVKNTNEENNIIQEECQLNSVEESNQNNIYNQLRIKEAIKKIRFLTLTPKEFAEGPARSNLLTQSEALAIFINISSSNISDCSMPEGFSLNNNQRNIIKSENIIETVDLSSNDYEGCSTSANFNGMDMELTKPVKIPKLYCDRRAGHHIDYRNTSVTDCSLTFQVDKNILITGVQVPTQVLCGELMDSQQFVERYTEILYAHILDAQGSRLAYTHCTSPVRYDSFLEISFDRLIHIQKNRMYKIGVVFNKVGWYPMFFCHPNVICERVHFTFYIGSPGDSVRDGFIRAIVFKHPY